MFFIIFMMLQSVCSDELLLLYALHMSCRIQYQHDQMNFTYNVCYMFSDNAYKSSGITLNFLCRLDMILFSYKLHAIVPFIKHLNGNIYCLYINLLFSYRQFKSIYTPKPQKPSFIIIVVFVIYFVSYLF